MEAKLERKFYNTVKLMGGWCIKFLPYIISGFPDRFVLLPGGRIVFVELKDFGKTPRKLQLIIHKRLRALGFTVLVIDRQELIDKFKEDYAVN